jgi:hypothetical protein
MLSRIHAGCLVVATLLSLLASAPHAAQAQDNEDDEVREGKTIPADFKGMVGLGLIGAELGFVIPAVAGLHDTWAFIVFPIAGAAGGATAGYFLLEKGEGEPEIAVVALTAGMALVIPALIVTLSATAYTPEEATQVADLQNPGLLRLSDRGVRLAPPAVSVVPGASERESLRTGASTEREVHVAVVSGKF